MEVVSGAASGSASPAAAGGTSHVYHLHGQLGTDILRARLPSTGNPVPHTFAKLELVQSLDFGKGVWQHGLWSAEAFIRGVENGCVCTADVLPLESRNLGTKHGFLLAVFVEYCYR